MNIIDYTRDFGSQSFAERGFCEVDAAVLCQLSYLKFEFAVPEGRKTLLETMRSPEREHLFDDSRFGENQRRLYFEAAFSKRFQSMKIRKVESVRDEKADIGFCALVFEPEGAFPAVVFRGTDEYLVGWKEDFALAYRTPIPSQTLSVSYLSEAMRTVPGFYICGHSKGGNLAQYSAMNASQELRSRIVRVYNLDGPGFAESVADSEGYGELKDRIEKLVPEESFVGQLLNSCTSGKRIECEGAGIMQHELFKWHTNENGDFAYLEKGKSYFKPVAEHINKNIAALSPEQLEGFVEARFGIMDEAKIRSLVELG